MKIIWKPTGNDPNDLVARVGEDILRVERMDEKYVWWAIWIGKDYKNSFDVHHSKKPRPKTIDEAKAQCEEKYKEVKNKK